MSMPKLIGILPLALMLAGTPALAEDKAPMATITLSGSGELKLAPDAAVVSIGVSSEAKTAKDALAANTRAVTGIVEQVKAAGIEPKNLRTAQFSINPVHATRKRADGREVTEVVGYQVANLVAVRVAPIEKLGGLLDQVVQQGANQINGLDFVVDGADRKLDEARAAAIADARRKAEIYATGAGVKLGRVLSIAEGGAQPMPVFKATRAMAAEMAAAPVPVEAGTETLSTQVSVTWELVNPGN